MEKWVNCDDKMPEEYSEGLGTTSRVVKVLLSDGREAEDWLINGKWTIFCKKNGGSYPVKWREK